ncbi:insulinase family protein [Marinomonas sp. IMCC 4694]|uniref:insulinase family protein n=1 Tax=Marinomonas sp. IMCC 4694 TaxID=2605432 RepID=UPI0011E80189|nr:insulinase family protein [Marinomonas sp. IMCC 4694]TYL49198.1 insulinase family protein [Marinomonas sp. IMCC 4694]
MADSDKPLFSRPVLAAVMLCCTLAIWLLNLTAPSNKLPIPDLERWQTSSDIPVIWLKQPAWQNSNKLEVRFLFRADAPNTALTQTTLAMLMSDSFPLSTSSINQRLAPLAAKVSSYYDHESQVIGLTMSNETNYLLPTLSLVTRWLEAPDFKQRTFEQWQRQQQTNPSPQHELEQRLFAPSAIDQNTHTKSNHSLVQVKSHYFALKHAASAIIIVGDLSDDSKQALQTALNLISQDYRLAEATRKPTIHSTGTAIAHSETPHHKGNLWQSRSAIALAPITSVEDWVSLQLWGADLVSTLNQQTHIDFVQLALTLSPQQPWASWSIQYSALLPVDSQSSNSDAPVINAPDLALFDRLPSLNDKANFEELFDTFKRQIEQQTLSPTWWSDIAAKVTHENSKLTLETFAADYQNAIDSFTQEKYQNALQRLLIPSSYQEIQIHQ